MSDEEGDEEGERKNAKNKSQYFVERKDQERKEEVTGEGVKTRVLSQSFFFGFPCFFFKFISFKTFLSLDKKVLEKEFQV